MLSPTNRNAALGEVSLHWVPDEAACLPGARRGVPKVDERHWQARRFV